MKQKYAGPIFQPFIADSNGRPWYRGYSTDQRHRASWFEFSGEGCQPMATESFLPLGLKLECPSPREFPPPRLKVTSTHEGRDVTP